MIFAQATMTEEIIADNFAGGGGEWDADGLWKPNEKGLSYGRVLDYIGVRY